MSDEMKEKVARLPAWARELINALELRPQSLVHETGQLRKEVERLRAVNRQLSDRIDAMVEMFQCAAKGGNEIAQAVQRIVEDYTVSEGEI